MQAGDAAASLWKRLRTTHAPHARDENDNCKASCVDWYGNARPPFVDDRVFALLGYELIEGSIGWDTIQEVQRVTFAPRRTTVAKD